MLLVVLGVFITVLVLFVTFHREKKVPLPVYYFADPKSGKKEKFPDLRSEGDLDLSIIVPAYNEEERLPVMLKETMDFLSERKRKSPGFTFEIIVVNDGSKDRTSEVALEASKQYSSDVIRVLDVRPNRGKGHAVQQGMLHARGRLLLMADADAATDINDLVKLENSLEKIKRNGLAMTIGSRAHLAEDAVKKRNFLRNLAMHGFNFLVTSLCVRGIRDTQCGFKLFTRPAARLVFPAQHIERWCFDVELLYLAQYHGVPIEEIPVNWTEVAGSKLNVASASIEMARDLFLIRLKYILSIWSPSSHFQEI